MSEVEDLLKAVMEEIREGNVKLSRVEEGLNRILTEMNLIRTFEFPKLFENLDSILGALERIEKWTG